MADLSRGTALIPRTPDAVLFLRKTGGHSNNDLGPRGSSQSCGCVARATGGTPLLKEKDGHYYVLGKSYTSADNGNDKRLTIDGNLFKLVQGRPGSSGQAQDEPGSSSDALRKSSNSDGQSSVKFHGHVNYNTMDTTSFKDTHRTVAIQLAELLQDAQSSKALSAHLDWLKKPTEP